MIGNIPYVDRLRQQLLAAGTHRPAQARFGWATRTLGRAVVAALLLIGVAVPLFALRGLGSRSASQTAVGASAGNPAITGQLEATTTKLQPGILALTVALGDVWIARVGDASSVPPAGLIRLDGTTGAVKATIPVTTVNRLEEDVKLAAAGGLIWVSEGRGDGPQTISSVDPTTNTVVGSVTVPGPVMGLTAAPDGDLWASISAQGASGILVEIDPAADRVTSTVAIPEAGSLSVAGSSLWLWIHDNNDLVSVQVDPATGAAGIKLEGTTGDVVYAGGLYWSIFSNYTSDSVSEETLTVNAVDPATGKTVVALSAPHAADLVVSAAGLWVASAPGYLPDNSVNPNEPATVSLIDPAARAFTAGPVPMDIGGPGIAAGGDALWVGDYESGNLTKVTFTSDTALPGGTPSGG